MGSFVAWVEKGKLLNNVEETLYFGLGLSA